MCSVRQIVVRLWEMAVVMISRRVEVAWVQNWPEWE